MDRGPGRWLDSGRPGMKAEEEMGMGMSVVIWVCEVKGREIGEERHWGGGRVPCPALTHTGRRRRTGALEPDYLTRIDFEFERCRLISKINI